MRGTRWLETINVDWIIEALTGMGIALSELRSFPALAAIRPDERTTVISFEDYLELLNWASIRLDDPFIGLHIGARMVPEQFGMFGYLLRNAAGIRQYCHILSRYIRLIAPDISLTFEERRETSSLFYEIGAQTRQETRHDVEHTLATLTTFLRAILGPKWRPDRVCFVQAMPERIDEFTEFFGPDVLFGQPRNSIEFSKALLDVRIHQSDTRLLAILQDQADRALDELASNPDVVSRARIVIVNELQSRRLTADYVAHQLNLSRTAFYARLQQSGTSFLALKDEIVLRVARKALADTQISLSEIAFMLGYSEHSAFVRGFVRLTGQTPSAYRRAAQASAKKRPRHSAKPAAGSATDGYENGAKSSGT